MAESMGQYSLLMHVAAGTTGSRPLPRTKLRILERSGKQAVVLVVAPAVKE